MEENRVNTLSDCLFTLASSLNSVLDRLDLLTDRIQQLYELHQDLISQNQEAFKFAREDFLRRLIEAEVEKHRKQQGSNKQSNQRRINFGSDIVRKAKKS